VKPDGPVRQEQPLADLLIAQASGTVSPPMDTPACGSACLAQSWENSPGLVVSDFRGATFGEIRAFPTWHQALEIVGLVDGDETGPS
jgi:hypothetical protein